MSKVLAILKTHTTTAVLVVLALALALYTLVIDRGSLTTEEKEARKYNLLQAWRIDDVTEIDVALTPPDGEKDEYKLTRPGKSETSRGWDITIRGKKSPAEDLTVFNMMSAFEYAKILREIPPANVDREAFGLDSPRARYTIVMGDLTFKIAIGKLAPSGEGYYVEVEGRGVYVGTKGFTQAVAVPSADLRSKAFLPYLSTAINALWLEGEGGTRKFERAPWRGDRGSGFRFADGSEGPTGYRVDAGRFDQILVALGKMQGGTLIDDDVAQKYAKPRVKITMIPATGPNGVLEVGGECPGKPELVIAMRREPSPLATCIPKAGMPALTRPAKEFEDDGVIGTRVDEIQELRIEKGDKVLDMGRVGTGFKVRRPQEMQISAEVGNHLLSDIIAVRGSRAPQDAKLDESEAITVSVMSQDEAKNVRVEKVRVGPAKGGQHLVVREEDGAKLLIGSSAALALRPTDLVLRTTDIIERRPMDLVELSVTSGGVTQTLKQDGSEVQLIEPKGDGLVPDRPYTSLAIATFVKLEAVRWVSESDDPAFSLDEPRLIVKGTFTDDSDKKDVRELRIGGYADDGVYATLVDDSKKFNGVFLLPRAFEEAFQKSFVSREAFKMDPGTWDRVEIEVGGVKAVLTRDGRQLHWEGRSDARATELEHQLAALDALRAISTGAENPEHGLDAPFMTVVIKPRKNTDDVAEPSELRYRFGKADAIEGVGVRFARRSDIEATYAVSLSDLRRIEKLVTSK